MDNRYRRARAARVRWTRVGLLLLLIAVGGLAGACSRTSTGGPADVGPVPSLSKDELERAQIAEEIRATREKAARDASASAAVLQWAPFATALVAVAGVGLALRTQRKDRQSERRKRHDEELARTVQNLGSNTARVRLNAAAALTAFLGPDSPDLGLDLLTVVIANLKVESDTSVADVLVRDLEIALRQCPRTDRRLRDLDLARSNWLVRLDLSGMDLTGLPVDVAFADLTRANLSRVQAPRTLRGWGAVLDHARLTGANLHEARLNTASCVGTTFHRTRLVSATFKDADLRTAQFQQASLQAAHFERARLQGAVFTDADVTDAWFCDAHHGNAAQLDEAALRTLARTRAGSWRRAHLAPAHRIAIEAFTGKADAMPRHAARLVRRGALLDAQTWYERALAAGVAVPAGALRKLGVALLDRGDPVAATNWLTIAANRGDDTAIRELATLADTAGP